MKSQGVSAGRRTARRTRPEAERYALLVQTAEALLAAENPQTIIEDLCRKVMDHLSCDVFFNYLVDSRDGLHLNACAGVPGEEIQKIQTIAFGQAVCGCVARDQQRMVAEDIQNSSDSRTVLVKSFGVQAYCCHPLLSGGRLIGTLSFGTKRRTRFVEQEIDLMKTVSNQVAIAMERILSAQALRASEERFRRLVEVSSQIVWVTNAAGQPIEDSPSWRAYTGLRLEDWLGDNWLRATHPDDRERIAEAWASAVATRTPYKVEFRQLHKSGEYRDIACQAVPILDAAGSVREWVGMNVDVTEQRRAADALRQSESFHRQILESIPGMVFTTRPDGYCDYQSKQWVEYTGVPMTEHLGDGWNQLLHPDDRQRAYAAWRAAVQETAPYDLEYRVRRKDGKYEWFKVNGRPIRDNYGRIVRWFGVAVNIEELKQAEAALRESEERFRTMADGLPLIVWVHDAQGQQQFVNRTFCEFLGVRVDETVGGRWQLLIHPDDDGYRQEFAACTREHRPFHAEARVRRADGEWRWIESWGRPRWSAAHQFLGFVGTSADVTERKLMEQRLENSLCEKDVMLREIHHRVKNNLQIISSLVSLQGDNLQDPPVRGLFQDVRDRVRSMALVHEKLYQSDTMAQVDFSEYSRTLLAYLWRAHANEADYSIELKLELEPVTLPMDLAVPSGLLLNELATNALKHGFVGRPGGEVTVALRGQKGAVRLSVSDSGNGLPAGMDWQDPPSLGLQLVQMLVRQLKGRLQVRSQAGTEFIVEFPLPETIH